MAAVEHTASTAGGPQTQWGVCSCGWAAEDEHRGPAARACAQIDADAHIEWMEKLAELQRAYRGGS